MKFDGGVSEGKLWNFFNGIPPEKHLPFAVFALTPGIPTEFTKHAFQIAKRPRILAFSFYLVNKLRDEAEPLAIENAATVTMEDGYELVRLLRRRPHQGIIPHWSALAITERIRQKTIKEVAAELGVSFDTARRWRRSHFHPLTLQRIVPPRGWNQRMRRYETY